MISLRVDFFCFVFKLWWIGDLARDSRDEAGGERGGKERRPLLGLLKRERERERERAERMDSRHEQASMSLESGSYVYV